MTEALAGGPAEHGTPRSLAHRSLATAAAIGLSHAIQLGSSLILVASLGSKIFAEVGLARAVVVLAIFLGELGYGPYFAREVAIRSDKSWLVEWQYSLFHKIVALFAACVILIVAWRLAFSAQAAGTAFLIGASPGMLVSAFGQAPLLYGWRRSNAAALAQPILWGTNLICILLTISFAPKSLAPPLLGLGFSIGYVVQALYFTALTRRLDFYVPKLGLGTREMRHAAGHMTGMSLIGAAYDRSTLFFIQILAPQFMAAYLIIDQLLNGLNTLSAQIQRLLLPDLSLSAVLDPENAFENICRVARPVLGAVYMALVGSIFAFTFLGRLHGGLSLYLVPGIILVLDWYVRAGCSIATPAVLAFRQEAFLFRLLWITCSVALGLQMALLKLGILPVVLAIRLANGAVVFTALRNKLGGSPISIAVGAAGLAVTALAAFLYGHSAVLGAGFAVTACGISVVVAGLQILRQRRAEQNR